MEDEGPKPIPDPKFLLKKIGGRVHVKKRGGGERRKKKENTENKTLKQ